MDTASSVAWLVLSVVVVVLDLLCVAAICHYRNSYHGTDITLLLVIIPMMFNAVFTLPIPAVLTLGDLPWTWPLCSVYIWIVCTLRLTQILGIFCLSLQWALFMRITGETQNKISTFATPWIMAGALVLSGLFAILPVAGVAKGTYFNSREKTCAFLPYDWGIGFSVFFVVLICAISGAGTVCLVDATLLLKFMKRVAVTKYRAERFHVPATISTKYRHGKRNVQDRYGEMLFASDLCRFVFIFVMVSTLVNHIPYAVIQCMQLVYTPDRNTVEEITLWLVLADCLLLPHTLWFLSKRYRHGVVYFWKVHILRNTTAEEDPMACMLQSYGKTSSGENGSLRIIGVQNPTLERLPRSGVSTFADPIGRSPQAAPKQLPRENQLHELESVTVHASNDLSPDMTTYISHKPQHGEVSVKVNSYRSPDSPVKRFMNSPDNVERSSSRSRQEWKEQMRRKHLPAIFVNDAFEKDDSGVGLGPVKNTPVSMEPEPMEKSHKKAGSNSSLYYFSGEYHPDNLTSSFVKQLTESESDGMSYQYDTVDISIVLDDKLRVTEEIVTEDSKASESGTTPPKKPLRKQQSVGKTSPKALDESSITSDNSVVLTPRADLRRPLWLDEALNSESFQNSLTFPSATSSQRSNSPPSVQFDDDVDKGFEEALAIGYASVSAVDDGPYFESISDEFHGPSDTSTANNPFSMENIDDTQSEGSFVTKAVVSKQRNRSYSSDTENPFDKVPMTSRKPKTAVKDSKEHHANGNGDSGTGTWTDYSNGFIDVEIRDDDSFSNVGNSQSTSQAWPQDGVDPNHDGMSFDSDFSDDKFDYPEKQIGIASNVTKDFSEIHDEDEDVNIDAKTPVTAHVDAAYF